MTISPDTIRTVIEVVPGWRFNTEEERNEHTTWFWMQELVLAGELGWKRLDKISQPVLDALAAAATEVVDKTANFSILQTRGVTTILKHVPPQELWLRYPFTPVKYLWHEGPNRTENTLEAIAKWVKSGGFDVS